MSTIPAPRSPHMFRSNGYTDAPIQAWPLMRRLGQLPEDMQELAVAQMSGLLDMFEALHAREQAQQHPDSRQPARITHLSWAPTFE